MNSIWLNPICKGVWDQQSLAATGTKWVLPGLSSKEEIAMQQGKALSRVPGSRNWPGSHTLDSILLSYDEVNGK